MLDSFDADFGEDNYPESYAGSYITDENKLCVLLTEDSPAIRESYTDYCQSEELIEFVSAKYSYADLENAFDSLATVESTPGFTNAYIDVVDNSVKLGVTTVPNTPNTLSSSPMIEFVYEPDAYTETVELYGGIPLSGYTLGGCGSFQGKNAVVLCGHGLYVGKPLILASNGTEFATVVIQQYATDENYDYAVATINSGAGVTLSNKVKNDSNYTTITSQSNRIPAVGSTICMYGKTGGFGVGKVTATSSVMRDSNSGVVCYGLVKCRWNDGQEAYGAGSSGGPVYSGHVFYGTYTGSNSTGGDFWFSPIGAVPSFTIKTS